MAKILKQSPNGISWLELLLDETMCEGEILVEQELAAKAGGINDYLSAKQKYEFLIRIAFEQPVIFQEEETDSEKRYLILKDDDKKNDDTDSWKTDCYIAGRYSAELQKTEMLNPVIETILGEAQACNRENDTLLFLEHMMRRDEEYWKLAEGSCPILIYKGDDVCHNVLNIFAEQFGSALQQLGRMVVFFDLAENEINKLTQYQNYHFQAIIGIQSYVFSIKMKDEIHYLHEYIYGPKYNFIFDHPVWMKKHLLQRYSDFYVLTHDEYYVTFIKRYFRHEAILFPPAGIALQKTEEVRQYDLTFVGTYGDYWNEVLLLHQMDRKKRFLANHFLLQMRKNPLLTAEQALKQTLEKCGIEVSEKEFLDVMSEMRRVIYCVMNYYRDRVLQSILESGIKVDVFGDSWENCPLRRYPNLIVHPNVTVQESLAIWEKSKLSLNVMSWHKGGFTERMANIMLAGAVLVTDDTTYLNTQYTDKDLVSFQLDNLKVLPKKIKDLLRDEEKRRSMAENGREKTLKHHTWKIRAEQFLEILHKRQE